LNHAQPSWEEIVQILKTSQTIAVVGISSKLDRPGYTVPAYPKEQGTGSSP